MRRALVAVAVVVTALAIPAQASTFLAMTPGEMVNEADAVVRGRVVETNSFWSESGRVVMTEARVAVKETIAGDAPTIINVRTAGGQVGDFRVEASGFPSFEKGDRVILFVKNGEAMGAYRVVGYQLGHYSVVKRDDGVRVAVPQTDEGVRFLTRSGRLMPEPRSVRLRDFRRGVRRIVRQQQQIAE